MALATTLALLKGGAAIGGFLANRFGPNRRFEDTAYGKRLKLLSNQGAFSPQARSNIVGGVAREAGGVAQREKAAFRGGLIQRGMEGSIAGQRGLADIGTKAIDTVSRARKDIETRNELSKERARNEFAQGKTSFQERLRQRNEAATGQLVSGLFGAGIGLVQGKMAEKAAAQEFGLKEGEFKRRKAGTLIDFLKMRDLRKKDQVPDINTASDQDIENYLASAKSDDDLAVRKQTIFRLLKRAGKIDQFFGR